MPWIAFKNLKKVQVTYFYLLKLYPPFVRLSFTLGCCKPAVSKVLDSTRGCTAEVTKILQNPIIITPLKQSINHNKQ